MKELNLNLNKDVYVIVRTSDNLYYDFVYITQNYSDACSHLNELNDITHTYKIAEFIDVFKIKERNLKND